MKLYYNENVYSPKFSSIDTIKVVDKLVTDANKESFTLLDVGCGTGIIGLGVKTLHPNSVVTLCDIDKEAVKVTKLNAKRLGLDVTAMNCDMVPKYGFWDVITANLPTYSDEDMEQDLHGPKVAYYAGKEPLLLYDKLFVRAKGRCRFLVCECQEKYQKSFLELAERRGWQLILSSEFGFAFYVGEEIKS